MLYKLNLWRILLFYKTCAIQQLPKVPGLYYVVERNRSVLYVGLAGAKRSNLYDRWNAYAPHKMAGHVNNNTVKLYYRPMARWRLQYAEACEIQRFSPPYNVQRPSPKTYYRLWSDWWLILFVTLITIIMFQT